jgi:hypothetical protein
MALPSATNRTASHRYVADPATADLLQKYGLVDQTEIDAIEAFVRHAYDYGNDTLKNGLTAMFTGMENAVRVYLEMKQEIHTLHEGILSMKQEALEMKEQLAMAEQYSLASSNYATAMMALEQTESAIHERDRAIEQSMAEQKLSKIRDLEYSNASMRTGMDNIRKEFGQLKEECAAAEKRSMAVATELHSTLQKQLQLTSLPGAPFYDPSTQTAMACPVLQSNGQMVPLKAVITQWAATSSPHDGYMHRTYVCPVMLTPTTLASTAVQERMRHVAQHAGVDTTLPLLFTYQSETGQETEFRFEDQLGIISKICAIQTMKINQCVEHAITQHNTMAIELNATLTQASQSHVYVFNLIGDAKCRRARRRTARCTSDASSKS